MCHLTLAEGAPYPRSVSDVLASEECLLEQLRAQRSLIVAYSGGVDSAYLAWAAHRALGERSLAVTALSPSYPRSHREMALRVAREVGFAHRFVETHELDDPRYRENPNNRCYFCKNELFDLLEQLRQSEGIEAVAYGINTDDTGDHRPGHLAAHEHAVLSPLLDAGLGKSDIRELSRRANLPTADLPASACLSSRIPYGMEVTRDKLAQIDAAEDALRALGYRQLRVRHHGDLARIELAPDEMGRALAPGALRALSRAVHEAGFRWVSLDLDGYRTGSLNEVIQIRPAASRE